MRDMFQRAGRTLFQIGFVTSVLTLGEEWSWWTLSEGQERSLLVVLTPIFALFQNAGENAGVLPAMMKKVPEEPDAAEGESDGRIIPPGN